MWGFLVVGSNDFWLVATAALAAMAAAVPGVFLLVRRQSMMGDALSHSVLPGIVGAFLLAWWLERGGWIPSGGYALYGSAILFCGALAIGVLTSVLTEWVRHLGRVEGSAALGVVFVTLFAAGLLMIRAAADSVHLDPDCVLWGLLEVVVVERIGGTGVPRAAATNAAVLLVNLALLALFFKELRISAFDPALATALGFNARWMHYGLMAVTAATVVIVFETVGSILTIAMLIVPAATAHLLTDRLGRTIALALLLAATSAAVGFLLAVGAAPRLMAAVGFPQVEDVSIAGAMAAGSGLLFLAAVLLGPRYGLVSRLVDRTRLSLRIAAEDVLGLLYRLEEAGRRDASPAAAMESLRSAAVRPLLLRLALRRLRWRKEIAAAPGGGFALTDAGRRRAAELVRGHRLWETFLSERLDVPADRLHESAHRAEHFLDEPLRDELADAVESPGRDPHGRSIPPRSEGTAR